MTVEFADAAIKDVQAIRDHYESQRDGLGIEFAERLDEAVERIRNFPESGQQLKPNHRRILLSKFPYGVYYRCEETRTLIVGVIHLRRHPSSWRGRISRS